MEQHITEVKLNQERRKAQVIPAIQQQRPQPQAINMAASQVARIHKVQRDILEWRFFALQHDRGPKQVEYFLVN